VGVVMFDDKKVREAFRKIREERDEHLESINELTTELQSAFEYISDMEHKYDKLKEIIDELQMFKNSMLLNDKSHFSNVILSLDEQKLFLTLYVFGEKEPLSYKYLVKKLAMEENAVKMLLSSLLDKKMPITRERIGTEWYFNIDQRFRELQTKENLIKIHESVSKGIYEKSLKNFF
jgi:septal ring factor EnvC (AmiA/AmiB activator)